MRNSARGESEKSLRARLCNGWNSRGYVESLGRTNGLTLGPRRSRRPPQNGKNRMKLE
jgi:hypothetical protein